MCKQHFAIISGWSGASDELIYTLIYSRWKVENKYYILKCSTIHYLSKNLNNVALQHLSKSTQLLLTTKDLTAWKESKVFYCYPVSSACCTPAGVVVHPLSGARHLFTLASCQIILAQPHLCLQSAGGSHIPAQLCATLSYLTLCHRHRHVVLHSFQHIWKKTKKHCYAVKPFTVESYVVLWLTLVHSLLPCWSLNGQDFLRNNFPFHHTCKQRFINENK